MAVWGTRVTAGLAHVAPPQFQRPRNIHRIPIAELRGRLHRFTESFGRVPKGLNVSPAHFGNVGTEWVCASGSEASAVVLYLHGGAFVAGSPETHRPLAARLAQSSGARVFSVDYRLAPEYPYPAALRDSLDAYRWLLEQRIPARQIVFAGDCAGGGLALSTIIAIRNAALPQPAGCVLMSPWADLAMASWSYVDNVKTDRLLDLATLGYCARSYLDETLPTEIYASPIYADLSRLCPLFIQAGSAELMRDDATRIAERARAAGVHADIEIHSGMQHVFQGVGRLAEAKGAMTRVGAFVRNITRSTAAAGGTN